MTAVQPPLRIFHSYSHKDEWIREELGKHLAPLRQEGLITDWHDRRIRPGENWEESISNALEQAQLVLLLVSSDFMASQYCYGVELARAIELSEAGRALVIPIIVRPCLWEVSPVGKLKLQATPKDAQPVTSWPNIDEAFLDVVGSIYELVQTQRPTTTSLKVLAEQAARRWSVPYGANRFFTGRDALLESVAAGLGSGRPVVLHGPAGTGKSAIGVEYAHRNRGGYRLVWWIRAEHRDSALADLAELAEALGLPETDAQEQTVLLAAVHKWLEQNSDWLLLFDNAADQTSLEPLLPRGRDGHVLITSRSPVWERTVVATEVGPWSREESIAYLLARTGEDDRESADHVAALYRDLPLALEQATAFVDQERARVA